MKNVSCKQLLSIGLIAYALFGANSFSASIAYIHGRVANDGTVLAQGVGSPYDQMLLTDSGRTGLSEFKQLVEGQGHTISQFRDSSINLNAAFLNNHDVVIFGLHQKIWSSAEKTSLDSWLRAGGGMFIYSDSASGGFFGDVGAQNTTGQTVTNNLIAQYGMQVTVDQADGTNGQTVNSNTSISAINGLTLEGEGVSPVAIGSSDTNVEVLVPYKRNKTPLIPHPQNISIANPEYASLVLIAVAEGYIVVMFDRQPMWNDGPGSDIDEQDNRVILRELVNFLAEQPIDVNPDTPPTSPPMPGNGDAVVAPILPLLLDE
jgi:hypothetical protein